jgi:transposase-like protein
MREAMKLVCRPSSVWKRPERIGAARYERTESRTNHRHGSRPRLPSTKAGDVELAIPKLREGSFIPALLEPGRQIDRVLWAVIGGVRARGVDPQTRNT